MKDRLRREYFYELVLELILDRIERIKRVTNPNELLQKLILDRIESKSAIAKLYFLGNGLILDRIERVRGKVVSLRQSCRVDLG